MRIRFTQVHRFAPEVAVNVTYGCPDAGAPQAGDLVEPDGSDPAFPKGVYVVKRNRWEYNVRGCAEVIVELEPET